MTISRDGLITVDKGNLNLESVVKIGSLYFTNNNSDNNNNSKEQQLRVHSAWSPSFVQ